MFVNISPEPPILCTATLILCFRAAEFMQVTVLVLTWLTALTIELDLALKFFKLAFTYFFAHVHLSGNAVRFDHYLELRA